LTSIATRQVATGASLNEKPLAKRIGLSKFFHTLNWTLLGWGIGLFCHWFFVLGPGGRCNGL
jgi:hypothetical protein